MLHRLTVHIFQVAGNKIDLEEAERIFSVCDQVIIVNLQPGIVIYLGF